MLGVTIRDLAQQPKRASSRGVIACAIAALMAIAAASPAHAQDGEISAVAQIRGETRITKLADLDFGTIIPGDTGGTIVIAPDSTVTTTGSVISSGTTQPAEFNITRRFFQDFPTYEGPQSTDTVQLLNLANSSQTLTLREFTTDFDRPGIFGLPAYFFATSYDFRVAGTLDIPANQPGGVYRGFFTVTIDYN